MINRKVDYLPNTNCILYQRNDMFKMTTDTTLLGNFIKIKTNMTVLDIGCNNGVLMLYCSRFIPKKIVGIDVLKDACELCDSNMKLNNIENYEIINADINDVKLPQFDVIVSNPPYDKLSCALISASDNQNTARFTNQLTLEILIEHVRRYLKDNGKFFMIYPASKLNNIIELLRNNKMSAEVIELIYNKSSDSAKLVMLKIVKRSNTECRIYHRHLEDK
ncbi:MAG: methyltransferase domain-containing protein [Erysipelotrichaceae bacterium]|nr:methyltransferase domain-containing protein [Erysipelotrichaceae bacterium]